MTWIKNIQRSVRNWIRGRRHSKERQEHKFETLAEARQILYDNVKSLGNECPQAPFIERQMPRCNHRRRRFRK